MIVAVAIVLTALHAPEAGIVTGLVRLAVLVALPVLFVGALALVLGAIVLAVLEPLLVSFEFTHCWLAP